MQSGVHFHWRGREVVRRYRSGVSLHSHTLHSKENLGFLPRYAAKVPVLARAVAGYEHRYQQCKGKSVDYSRAWWTPPLSPLAAHELERRQIADLLDLSPFVSLSDHDDIEAGMSLHVLQDTRDVPVSVEWTVPYAPAFFHIGVHNLPPARARGIMGSLASFTNGPAESRLPELLEYLNGFPEVLVILNHPLWDEAEIGAAVHAEVAQRLLGRYGRFIHALELNGMRPWRENNRTRQLAASTGHPVISGGDRHAAAPNANVNLTNAGSFSEFAAEVRQDRISDVLFLPQYREPLRMRMLEDIFHIVRDYPDLPGRERWCDRIYFIRDAGYIAPLSECWNSGGPLPVRLFLGFMQLLRSRRVRSALRLALADGQEAAP